MYLRIRNTLPWVVGAAWMYLSWRYLLGAPSWQQLMALRDWGGLDSSFSSLGILTWFAALFAAMILVDRLWCRIALWRVGVDPMKMHWSRLRNRNGNFFCAACHGIFMLPPEDLSDEGWVHCGDCGHAVAPYGEMKPLLRAHAAEQMRRWPFRLWR
jgi:hypothetical protein